jgi:hypothetical protein
MSPERDRSAFALVETAIAILLVASWWLPWFKFTPVTPDMVPTGAPPWSAGAFGLGDNGVTDADLLVAIVPPLLVVLAASALALPWRGFVVALLVAFVCALFGAFGMIDKANSGMTEYLAKTTPDVGLQAFAWMCLAGALVTAVDLTRNGSTTVVWRKLRTPAIGRYGPFAGYVLVVLAALLIALFPMSASWTWLVFGALLAGLIWWARALRAA